MIVREPSAAASGDETDQPPSRTSTAAAAAGIVERSSRTGAVGSATGSADGPAARGPSECLSRPAAVQPVTVPSPRSVPAAITSESRQASCRTVSTSSIVPLTISSSSADDPRVAASQGARMSSRELPSLRTSTRASGPVSRTVPRRRGARASCSRPRSSARYGRITAARPARSLRTTSRYSTPPSHRQVAPPLVMPPSMPASAAASGRSRRLVCTITAGAAQTAATTATSASSAFTRQRRRGRSLPP